MTVDGGWSAWSPWTQCTPQCSGFKRRSRSCTNPAPVNGGATCHGDVTQRAACHCPGTVLYLLFMLFVIGIYCTVSCFLINDLDLCDSGWRLDGMVLVVILCGGMSSLQTASVYQSFTLLWGWRLPGQWPWPGQLYWGSVHGSRSL